MAIPNHWRAGSDDFPARRRLIFKGEGIIMFCSNCGTENDSDSKFCKGCGSMLREITEAPDMISASQHAQAPRLPGASAYPPSSQLRPTRGLIALIVGIAGIVTSLITIISDIIGHGWFGYTYSSPLTDHETFMITVLIISIIVTIIGWKQAK